MRFTCYFLSTGVAARTRLEGGILESWLRTNPMWMPHELYIKRAQFRPEQRLLIHSNSGPAELPKLCGRAAWSRRHRGQPRIFRFAGGARTNLSADLTSSNLFHLRPCTANLPPRDKVSVVPKNTTRGSSPSAGGSRELPRLFPDTASLLLSLIRRIRRPLQERVYKRQTKQRSIKECRPFKVRRTVCPRTRV